MTLIDVRGRREHYDNLVWSSADTEQQLPCNSLGNDFSVWTIVWYS